MVQVYTKERLIEKFRELRNKGWVLGGRQGNVGGVGNTVEDFLGIKENNLPIPNAAEWELKCQRADTSSLTTLFHMEPSPRALKFVPKKGRKVLISFDAGTVSSRHKEWLESVKKRVGICELNPQPYWGFDDLFHKAGTKLLNCFFVKADVKQIEGREYFKYTDIKILQKFSLERFVSAIEKGFIYVDFDARTGHNHGTKFRMKQDKWPELYETVIDLE